LGSQKKAASPTEGKKKPRNGQGGGKKEEGRKQSVGPFGGRGWVVVKKGDTCEFPHPLREGKKGGGKEGRTPLKEQKKTGSLGD